MGKNGKKNELKNTSAEQQTTNKNQNSNKSNYAIIDIRFAMFMSMSMPMSMANADDILVGNFFDLMCIPHTNNSRSPPRQLVVNSIKY